MRRALISTLFLVACGGAEVEPTLFRADDALTIFSRDKAESIDIASWNIEWFGSTREGPSDEKLQQDRARDILGGLNLDVYGLVEITSNTAFNSLMAGLPSYEGFLANDVRVENGARFYSANEQKVGLLVKRGITVTRARLILIEQASLFGGRPPLEVSLRMTLNGATRTLIVIVAHFKAMTDRESYQARVSSSAVLKELLDREYPTRWVLVVGDYNDDLFRSTRFGLASPFKNFVDDSARYHFSTEAISRAGIPTYLPFSSTIDHHLATNELAARGVGDAEVVPLDKFVRDYVTTVSDHLPVMSRFDLR